MSLYNADGQISTTQVNGSTYTGLYASDGSYNIVINSSSSYIGLFHSCGALNAFVTTNPYAGYYAPNGSVYVILNNFSGYSLTIPLGRAGGSVQARTQIVGTRGSIAAGATAAIVTANQLQRIHRMRHYLGGQDIARIAVVHGNYYTSTTSGELTPGNSCDLQGSLEIPTVGVSRFKWSGNNTVTLADGNAYTISDWLLPSAFSLSKFTKNTQVWLRTSETIASGGKFCTWPAPGGNIGGEATVQSTATADPQLDTPGVLSLTVGADTYVQITTSGRLPLAIIGQTVSGAIIVSLVAIGSSILWGNNDNQGAGDGVSNAGGYFQRAMASVSSNHMPYLRIASAGETCQNFLDGTKRQALLTGLKALNSNGRNPITHALCDFDSNGMANGLTGAQAYVNTKAAYVIARAAGIQRVEQVNIQPRTTSTDSYTTVANQTPITGFEIGGIKRDAFQTAVLADIGSGTGADAFLDLSVATQSLSATDKWLTDEVTAQYLTTDGLHPIGGTSSTRGHVVMAPILNTRAATWTAV
jgi:hypothetical protein